MSLPDPHLLSSAVIRREAVPSSGIEGTEATQSDLVLLEVEPTAPGLTGDVRDVANCVRAVEHSRHRIWEWAITWVPIHIRRQIDDVGVLAGQALSGYTRGIILVAIADGILVFIGLVILQVPLAPALAVLVVFGALIPAIGAPIATVFAAVIALATEGPTTAPAVVVLTVVVGSSDGDILQTLITGRAVQVHPLAIVSAMAVGTLNFGIVGAVVAVPTTGPVGVPRGPRGVTLTAVLHRLAAERARRILGCGRVRGVGGGGGQLRRAAAARTVDVAPQRRPCLAGLGGSPAGCALLRLAVRSLDSFAGDTCTNRSPCGT